jgi:type IV pilus secretin PilQ/predicted competence protein
MKKHLAVFWRLILTLCLVFSSAPFCLAQGESRSEQYISIDFRDTEIGDVLRLLAKQHNLNIVLSEDVRGPVTAQLSNVTVKEAIKAIVTINGYAYTERDNVIKVTTPEAAEMEEPLTQVFALNNADAVSLSASLSDALSPAGKIRVDERSNSLIVTDLPGAIRKVSRLVEELDQITPQVLIEAKLVETVLDDTEDLGIDWTIQATAIGSKRPTTIPFRPKGEEDLSKILPFNKPSQSTAVGDFPVATRAATDVVSGTTTVTALSAAPPHEGYPQGFPFAVLSDFVMGTLDFSSFQAVLKLLLSNTKTSILSSPRISTLNNKSASILVGTRVPIPIYERNETTGTFEIIGYDEEQVGIKLTVTPRINPQGYIKMQIKPEVSSIDSYTGPNDERPVVSTREANTEVQIKNGETVVIGGLIKEEEVKVVRRVPILGYIPILGFPFQYKSTTKQKRDLLIFITAHILTEKERVELTQEEIVRRQYTEIFPPELLSYGLREKRALKAPRQEGRSLKPLKRRQEKGKTGLKN